MDDRVVITLFRHGLTEGNKRKAYMGWNDSPLSEEGKLVLEKHRFEQDNYDFFVSSDLKRCLSTMNILFPNVTPLEFPEWREMNFGAFQGKTYEELKDDEAYQLWVNNFFNSFPPEGESFEQFSARIKGGWARLVEQIVQHDFKSPFIVTHGGVIRYLLTQFAPVHKDFWEWKIVHGNGYELSFELARLRRGERCTLLQEVPLTESELG